MYKCIATSVEIQVQIHVYMSQNVQMGMYESRQPTVLGV